MIRRFTALALALAATATVSSSLMAQEKAAAPAADPVKLTLMDGSVLAGNLGTDAIEVQTKYGLLKIPLSDIKSFTPGLVSHNDYSEKLTGLIGDLGADGFAEREKATEALRKMGPKIRTELERALKGAAAEQQARLTKLIEEIDQMKAGGGEEEEGGNLQRLDTIVTDDFTVAGTITTKSFSVNSKYGPLTVKLGDIDNVKREGTAPDEVRKNVTVAGGLISQRAFENTGIRVSKGDVVTVTATGSIVMQPWGGNMTSGPDGGNNYGMMQPGNFPGGCLIAKINANGPLFKVGSKNTFTVDRAGIIMFGIAMQNDYNGYQFPGEYQLKVKVVKKAQ
jgi:hypothetical protein